jgi:hypothetical protein
MKIAAGLSCDQVSFVWVSSHWDVHLEGVCRHEGQLCRFECENPTRYDDDGGPSRPRYSIYSLSTKEKLRWLYRKKKFEICVGYHWTYPYCAQGRLFYLRKPRWLFALLWWWHYGKPYRGWK